MLFNYTSPDSDFTRLLDLGLSGQIVQRVVEIGAADAATYTSAEPKGAGEWARWARGVGELHRQLIPLGWEREDPTNQPTFYAPNRQHALILASGSASTGQLTFSTPTTKNPKGSSFVSAISANGQVPLFDLGVADHRRVVETWVLLLRAEGNKIFSEVSLPISMNNARIDTWKHRILLPPIEFEGYNFGSSPDDDLPDYAFTVMPK